MIHWKYLKYILIILCTYFIEKTFYNSYQGDNLFEIFIYSGLGALWVYCFFRIMQEDIRLFKARRSFIAFWKTCICLLSLTPLFVIYFHFQPKLDAPTLLFASNHGVYADFKTDGTYFIRSGSWASRKYYYGKYTLNDSVIKLDRPGFDNILVSNTLIIRNTNADDEKQYPTPFRMETPLYLVQSNLFGDGIHTFKTIDSAGNRVDVPERFKITTDNRKKPV